MRLNVLPFSALFTSHVHCTVHIEVPRASVLRHWKFHKYSTTLQRVLVLKCPQNSNTLSRASQDPLGCYWKTPRPSVSYLKVARPFQGPLFTTKTSKSPPLAIINLQDTVDLKGINHWLKISNFLGSSSIWTITPNFISVSKLSNKLQYF